MINPFKSLESIIRKLSEKYNLPQPVIESIIKSEFEFVRKVMNRGDCESVRLMYLGTFKVTPGRRLLAVDLKMHDKDREVKADIDGPEELCVPDSGNREGGQSKSTDMLGMPLV